MPTPEKCAHIRDYLDELLAKHSWFVHASVVADEPGGEQRVRVSTRAVTAEDLDAVAHFVPLTLDGVPVEIRHPAKPEGVGFEEKPPAPSEE